MNDEGNLKRKYGRKLAELNVGCKEAQLSRKQVQQDKLFIFYYLKDIKKYENKKVGNKLVGIVWN